MPYVVLQQVSSTYAKHNAGRTLDKPIAFKYFKPYVNDEDYERYSQKYKDGVVYIWGAKLERQHQIMKMIPRQTLVLFRRGKRVFRCGVISDLLVDVEFGRALWGLDDDGETWGIIYLMEKTKDVSIPAEEINSLIGRSADDNWQGMTSIEGESAKKLIEYVRPFLSHH